MRKTRRFFVFGLTVVLAIAFVETLAGWVQSYRSPRTIHFRTWKGRYELIPRRGVFEVDNQPQMDAELRAATALIDQKIQTKYAQLRDHYENSGRDLDDGAHPADRQAMSDLQIEIQLLDYDRQFAAAPVQFRWLRDPPVTHRIACRWIAILTGFGTFTGVFFAWRTTAPKLQPGKCRVCGYDLRATPERCPECGAVRLHGNADAG